VTEKSVEVHLGRAHRKLGIRSRWQLAEHAGGDQADAEPARAR
jgi:DNA-binding CsgD family transcriptional regulator